jgi:hemerythrin-like domain-containing protein
VLVKANKHHMQEEERDIFPIARKILSRAEVKEMTAQYPEVHLEEKTA